MKDRIQCSVPFCNRTRHARDGCTEFICGKHWAGVSRDLKREKYAAFRDYKRRFGGKAYWTFPAGSPQRLACVAADKRCDLAWKACKADAIEAAVGI